MSGDKPLRLSWSRLRVHDECPAKGDLLRRKSPVTDIRSFVHGNVVDLAQRRWLALDDPEPGWMLAHIDELFDESVKTARETGDGIVRWKSRTDKDETREFCRELVKRLEPILAKVALPFDYEPAVRFNVPVKIADENGVTRELQLVGEMDLLVRSKSGKVGIWDLKATRDNGYYRKVLGQLAFYTLAGWKLAGQRPAFAGLIQPMCDTQVLPVDVDDQALREISARIQRTARDIWAGRMAPKVTKDCAYCPVRNACPAFRKRPGTVTFGRAA